MSVRRYKGFDVPSVHPDDVYRQAQANARHRGIAWEFCMSTWWDVWREHWPRRQRESLIMCRYFDQGPYAQSNVYIGTPSQNARDRHDAALRRQNLSHE